MSLPSRQPDPCPSGRPARVRRRWYRLWPVLSLCVSVAMVVGIVAGTAPASAQARAEEDDSGGLVSGLVGLLSPSDDDESGKPQESSRPSPAPPEKTTSDPTTSVPRVPDPRASDATTPSPPPAPATSAQPSVPAPTRTSSPPSTSSPGQPPAEEGAALQSGASESGLALPTASPETSGASDTQPGPGRQWTLTASKLKLVGSRYHGYSMRKVAGKKVKTLHFTAQRLEITDLVQRGALGNGTVMRAESAPGRVSTVTDGPIHLYTRQLTGTLAVADYPLVPVTLSPDSLALPNLDLGFLQLPTLTFTDAVVRNVELSGGTLFIPDARITLE